MSRKYFATDMTMVILALVIYGLAGRLILWLAGRAGELSTLIFP